MAADVSVSSVYRAIGSLIHRRWRREYDINDAEVVFPGTDTFGILDRQMGFRYREVHAIATISSTTNHDRGLRDVTSKLNVMIMKDVHDDDTEWLGTVSFVAITGFTETGEGTVYHRERTNFFAHIRLNSKSKYLEHRGNLEWMLKLALYFAKKAKMEVARCLDSEKIDIREMKYPAWLGFVIAQETTVHEALGGKVREHPSILDDVRRQVAGPLSETRYFSMNRTERLAYTRDLANRYNWWADHDFAGRIEPFIRDGSVTIRRLLIGIYSNVLDLYPMAVNLFLCERIDYLYRAMRDPLVYEFDQYAIETSQILADVFRFM